MGHKNLGKVPMPRVVAMAKEPIIVSRRLHVQTVRPRQWHIAKGGPTMEKRFRKGG